MYQVVFYCYNVAYKASNIKLLELRKWRFGSDFIFFWQQRIVHMKQCLLLQTSQLPFKNILRLMHACINQMMEFITH